MNSAIHGALVVIIKDSCGLTAIIELEIIWLVLSWNQVIVIIIDIIYGAIVGAIGGF